jgi:NCAIR mutase (PurE)-related protein
VSSDADPSAGHVGGFARLDLDRTRRIDLPEAIYCQGKTTEQVVAIARRFLEEGRDALVATRVTPEQAAEVDMLQPDGIGRTTRSWRHRATTGRTVAVVSAGTSDLAVADECSLTLRALGHDACPINDVGVAGLHRLTGVLPQLERVDVVVAIAGMEGALPTVLAGLIQQPIIAVPTSVGYGSSLEGVTALLSMLASCAPGISVVGIDNGYGAACAAHRILTSIGR